MHMHKHALMLHTYKHTFIRAKYLNICKRIRRLNTHIIAYINNGCTYAFTMNI